MVCCSVSILSSASSFPSNSGNESSSPSTSARIGFFNATKRSPRCVKPVSLKVKASVNQSLVEDGAPEQFLDNNSIADFMRFKRGSRESNGELQTAVVSYKKKFPWSILQPFFQVDLVSTIHIADKEYVGLLKLRINVEMKLGTDK